VTIAFRDLRRETAELQVELRAAVDEVLAEGRFVGGDAVASFEAEFAEYCGATHAVGVGSGTDAIAIALRSAGIGAGDEVITAANTCVPTVAGIVLAGATPVLADIDPRTFTLDPNSAADAVGPRTRALVPVHLYGRRADMQPLLELAREHGLRVIEDAAQAHGAAMVADVAAFSFYPTKNLGALGDAGAVVTSDAAVAARARELREYGRRGDGRSFERSGQSRLDTIQAALLLAKLPLLDGWNARRSGLAGRYTEELGGGPVEVPGGGLHVYHLYVVRSPERDAVAERLRSRGVETLVHYPLAVHQHPAWSDLARPGALAESERAAREVLSLPLYPQLTDDEAGRVIEAVLA
jgi:dTDP-3-amino-3,4,6-trideoxy-alpha-D-glucose transaminase